MPYIQNARRITLLEDLGIAHDSKGQVRPDHRPHPRFLSPGELNFAITALMHEYVLQSGVNYANLAATLAQAEAAKLEFYRTVVAPYEDTKIDENGHISGLDK